jgi:hypothetical protein
MTRGRPSGERQIAALPLWEQGAASPAACSENRQRPKSSDKSNPGNSRWTSFTATTCNGPEAKKHREGKLEFKNLFKGTPGTPESYRLVLTRNDGRYQSPRHHHNFDQVRLPRRQCNIVPKVDIEAGDAGYFPRAPVTVRRTTAIPSGCR